MNVEIIEIAYLYFAPYNTKSPKSVEKSTEYHSLRESLNTFVCLLYSIDPF